jgi:hypothetical protein
MSQEDQHRIEALEAEVRRLRQCAKALYDAVIAGDEKAVEYAREQKAILER